MCVASARPTRHGKPSFFFQAEDGIRDLYVTGVQTCALPICLARVNVSGWCQAQPAGELCAQVADDVTEKIAGDDDIELTRVADDLHRQCVDVQMAGIDGHIFLPDFVENPLP